MIENERNLLQNTFGRHVIGNYIHISYITFTIRGGTASWIPARNNGNIVYKASYGKLIVILLSFENCNSRDVALWKTNTAVNLSLFQVAITLAFMNETCCSRIKTLLMFCQDLATKFSIAVLVKVAFYNVKDL